MATFGRIVFATVVVALLVIETVVAGDGVAEILLENGLPKGLLPGTVKSYSLSENGKFEVTLASACTTKIGTEEVYYKKSITGELSYGKIKNLSGIQAKEFFWVSISSIEVDKANPNIIWFEVGFLAKSLSVDLFQVPPTCNSLAMGFPEWLSMALDGTLEVNMPRTLKIGEARRILQ